MDDPAQALAYHRADFSASHGERVGIFRRCFPAMQLCGPVLDLGCGSGDVLFRFARAFPAAWFVGLDGSKPMLDLAGTALQHDVELRHRIGFLRAVIPTAALPKLPWQLVMSHSLLHQLHRPQVLWETIREARPPGGAVFVADLRRPASVSEAREIVAQLSGGEPEMLQRDFYNSLCAAFEPDEVRAQLAAAGLSDLTVESVGENHLVVFG